MTNHQEPEELLGERDSDFRRRQLLIMKEAALASSSLGNGLYYLRRSDMHQKGLYYQAFFSLSIGIERLLKLVYMRKYQSENRGKYPSKRLFRELGHDIYSMYKSIDEEFLLQNPISHEILKILSDFATTDRYHNLNVIGNPSDMSIDPLVKWKTIREEIRKKHCKPVERTAMEEELISLIDKVSFTLIFDIDGSRIDSQRQVIDATKNDNQIQGFSVYYTFLLILNLVEILQELERHNHWLPNINEFFQMFHKYYSISNIRRRRDWIDFVL